MKKYSLISFLYVVNDVLFFVCIVSMLMCVYILCVWTQCYDVCVCVCIYKRTHTHTPCDCLILCSASQPV